MLSGSEPQLCLVLLPAAHRVKPVTHITAKLKISEKERDGELLHEGSEHHCFSLQKRQYRINFFPLEDMFLSNEK